MSLEYQIGQVVYSKSGHDQGDVQMICAIEGEYLFLADGRRRKLEKPKRKKKKHVQPTFYVEKDLAAKLQTAVTSGEAPHIAQLEMGRTKMFADYGVLQDMTEPAREAGLDPEMFYDGLMDCCDWGEGLYALPFNRSTPMFYYNKDMFEEAGLDPETPPQTWDELREYASKLSIPNQRWGFEMPIDAWFYEAFIMQGDGRILNEDETDIGFHQAGFKFRESLEQLSHDTY